MPDLAPASQNLRERKRWLSDNQIVSDAANAGDADSRIARAGDHRRQVDEAAQLHDVFLGGDMDLEHFQPGIGQNGRLDLGSDGRIVQFIVR